MMKTVRRLPAALLGATVLTSTSGCAFDPGEPYGLVAATLDARYRELAHRATTDGFEQLDNDFQVRLTSASLTVEAVELVDAGVGAEVAFFDPANPPPGYSLCHGGHCHAADGSLVDYDTIAAELANDSGSAQTTAVTLVPGVVDLLGSETMALECEPSCALDEGYLVLARLTASRLELHGEVRDSRVEPRLAGITDWQVDLSLLEAATHTEEEHDHEPHETEVPPGTFELRLDLPVDEDEPPHIDLRLDLPTSAALLDRVDFGAVAPSPEGLIDLDAADGADAREQLTESFAAIEASVSVSRSEEVGHGS